MVILAPRPNPYTEAADLILALPQRTAAARSRLGLTIVAQAKQIGITPLTLARFESGSQPTQATILRVLRWLADH